MIIKALEVLSHIQTTRGIFQWRDILFAMM